jgi:Glycosyl transferase family 11
MAQTFLVKAKLPYAGLGNMLLVWARAYVFSSINSLPMEQSKWSDIHIGPWLRREKTKRYYGMYFRGHNYQSKLASIAHSFFQNPIVHENPPLMSLDFFSDGFSENLRHVFLFDKMPPWNDYFEGIKEYHSQVKARLLDDIHPSLLRGFMQNPCPNIAIHIRRGDYQAPQLGDDLAVRRYVYTPLQWYIDSLLVIRKVLGSDVPATVFSDGFSDEIAEILKLPNVSLSGTTCALSDMITMSRCKLLIGSAHSSFSAWASYLGQCPTIWPSERAFLYKPIFTGTAKMLIYEGGFDPFSTIPDLLKSNLILLENFDS